MSGGEVSLGELDRRLDRFERELKESVAALAAAVDRQGELYVRQDVYASQKQAVQEQIKEIKDGLRRARSIMWSIIVGVGVAIITAVSKSAKLW